MSKKSVSAGIPQVSFRSDVWKRIRQRYVDIKIKAFFGERNINFKNVWEVHADKAIISREYDVESRGGVPFSYFYEVILQGVERGEDGKITGAGYTLTFDRDEVRLDSDKESLHCNHSGLFYSEVCLGKTPVFYYLYFDFQEVIRKVKSLNQSAKY